MYLQIHQQQNFSIGSNHTGNIYIGTASSAFLAIPTTLYSNNSAATFNIGTNQSGDINLGNQGTANNVNVWTLVPKSIYMPSGSITLSSPTSTTAFKAFSGGVDISGPNGFIKLRGIYTRAGVSNNTVTTNLYNYYWDWFRMYCFVDDVNVGNSYSDYRCKENITKPQPILDRLCSIDMINYNYTKMGILDGKGNTFLGYYAHKLQEEFPEYETFVNGTKDEVNDDGTPKLQTINDITPLLMKAIQELKAQVDALKAQVEQLQGK